MLFQRHKYGAVHKWYCTLRDVRKYGFVSEENTENPIYVWYHLWTAPKCSWCNFNFFFFEILNFVTLMHNVQKEITLRLFSSLSLKVSCFDFVSFSLGTYFYLKVLNAHDRYRTSLHRMYHKTHTQYVFFSNRSLCSITIWIKHGQNKIKQ